MRTRILILADYYLPSFRAGGPVRSISGMVDAIGDDFECYIVTRNHDLGSSAPFSCARPGGVAVGKARVYYLDEGDCITRIVIALAQELRAHIVYLNSLMSPRFTSLLLVARRLGLMRSVPIVIAPRGELAPGAMAQKRLRKIGYVALLRAFRLVEGVLWQAANELEADQIRGAFGTRAKVQIAHDIGAVELANPAAQRAKRGGSVSVVYVGRIARNKNIAWGIRLLASLTGEVVFDVYGPAEDSVYFGECQRSAESLPANVRVNFHGAVPHSSVVDVLSRSHVFLHPTLGESFGHSVLEGLAAGCVMVLSDQTPWRNLASRGAGWDLALDSPTHFTEALQACVDMDDEEFQSHSRAAARVGREYMEGFDGAAGYTALFQLALNLA